MCYYYLGDTVSMRHSELSETLNGVCEQKISLVERISILLS